MTKHQHTCQQPVNGDLLNNWAHDVTTDLPREVKEQLKSCLACLEEAGQCFQKALRGGKLSPEASRGKSTLLTDYLAQIEKRTGATRSKLPPFPVTPEMPLS